MFISPYFQTNGQSGLIKQVFLTASGMLLHAFPSMFVSSLREFPENCVYKHDGLNCYIEYLHRKLLLLPIFSLMILKVLRKVHLLDLHIKTIISCSITTFLYAFNSSQK